MDTTDIIIIACKHAIKRAFKLFDDETRCSSLQQIIEKLRLTSKHLNNSICDELSLEIMHRWMKGRDRCARVTKRIEQLLHKCDYNGLFRFMDVVAKIFSKRESVRLLSSFLITITQHHKHILKDYMDFFISRELHTTPEEYFLVERSFPFPGFTPQQVEKSLQIANENGWIEESLLLFDCLAAYLNISEMNREFRIVRSAISNGEKLNRGPNIANRINNVFRNRHVVNYYLRNRNTTAWWFSLYLQAKQIKTSDVTEVVHDITEEQANKILVESDTNNKLHCGIISFMGAQLGRFYRRPNNALHFQKVKPSTKTFTGLPPSPDHRQRVYLYNFYCAVVENDIEKAKQIHRENNIILEHLGHHPHPLAEYLRVLITGTISPMQEMIYFLVENFGVEECMKGIEWRLEGVVRLWPIVRPLLDKGAKIYDILVWKKQFNESIPQNVRKFRALMDRSDKSKQLCTRAMDFLLNEFSRNSQGLISEAKILLLLAWRYDSTCHLSKLPKELFKIIVTLIDEPPLFIQYATIAIEGMEKFDFAISPIRSEALEHSGAIAKFCLDNLTKFPYNPWFALQLYTSERAVKRDAKYLRELYTTVTQPHPVFPKKVYRCFCKHETDDKLLKQLVKNCYNISSIYYKLYPLLEYAAVAKNIKLFNEFYSQPKNISTTLNEEIYASVAPNRKNKMSYEEAVELINQVRSKYLM